MFSRTKTMTSTPNYSAGIHRLADVLQNCDSVVIGAGAGLSTAAGFIYTGERFAKYFADFIEKYHFTDMYTGGFYPFPSQNEFWAYWSRYIYINRYMNAPLPVYEDLLKLVSAKDYFVITTNVDHCFQKAGFDKKRLFYTQGDYGLFQCSEPCHQEIYDNREMITRMVLAQGFEIDEEENLIIPDEKALSMEVPDHMFPICPVCGKPLTMNLRSDDRFVEDEGWHAAAERYQNFLRTRITGKILFLEIGVGYNTPVIIKYPFWQMTAGNPEAVYACLSYDSAACPKEIEKQSVCIEGDAAKILKDLAEAIRQIPEAGL